MNVSLEVGGLCRQIDSFLTEKTAATSPLLKVQLFERGQEFSDQVAAMQARLTAAREDLVAALKEIDAQWQGGGRGGPSDRTELLPALEEERFVQLAL
jgi:hypothetical protein